MAGRSIFLEKARTVVAATLKEGRSPGLQPLTVAVLDPDDHLLAFARDHTSYLRPQIAMAKAAGALALGLSTRVMAEMAVERPTFINSIRVINPIGVVPAPGGLLKKNADCEVVGAVGVTGNISDKDDQAAMVGIAALSL